MWLKERTRSVLDTPMTRHTIANNLCTTSVVFACLKASCAEVQMCPGRVMEGLGGEAWTDLLFWIDNETSNDDGKLFIKDDKLDGLQYLRCAMQ